MVAEVEDCTKRKSWFRSTFEYDSSEKKDEITIACQNANEGQLIYVPTTKGLHSVVTCITHSTIMLRNIRVQHNENAQCRRLWDVFVLRLSPGVAHLSDALGAEVVAWITAPVAASGAWPQRTCVAVTG